MSVMAAMGKIVRTDSYARPVLAPVSTISSPFAIAAPNFAGIFESTRVFRGRELTRKNHRIPCGILPIDNLTGGGIVRGRISEIIASRGTGKTSLAAAFAARVTQREAVAWIDTSGNCDPASIAAAGVELTRLLWVSSRRAKDGEARISPSQALKPAPQASLKAAEWILAAGGFGLVILDFGATAPQLSQNAVLRLARNAERCGAGVLVLAPLRICGTFAALTLTLRREHACFSRLWQEGPVLFEGFRLEACVARNKLGNSGQTVKWEAAIDGTNGLSAGQDSLGGYRIREGSRTAAAKHWSSHPTVRLTRMALAAASTPTQR